MAVIVSGLVGSLLTGLFGLGIRALTNRGERSVGMTPSYEALDKHVTRVQGEMSELWDEHRSLKTRFEDMSDDRDRFAEAFEEMRHVFREVVAWINAGAKPPPPILPPHIRDQVGDYELARITEVSRTTTQTERIVYPPEEQP